jgi:hypothetical protein
LSARECVHIRSLLLEREIEPTRMCELIRALEVVLLLRREILWLEKTWRQRWLCGVRSSDALHSLGRCIIAHSAYLHSSQSNNHIFGSFYSTGVDCYRCSTPRVHSATTTASIRCPPGCRDAIEFLWRCLADMKPGIADTRSGRRPVKSFSCSEQVHRSRL